MAEISATHGPGEADDESQGGRALVARHRDDTWGEMRTRRLFTVAGDGRITRFETGQAQRGRGWRVDRPGDERSGARRPREPLRGTVRTQRGHSGQPPRTHPVHGEVPSF